METVISQGNESFQMKPVGGCGHLDSVTRVAMRCACAFFNKAIDAWHC